MEIYNTTLLAILGLTVGTRSLDLVNSRTLAANVGMVSTKRAGGGFVTTYSANKDVVLNQDTTVRTEWVRKYGDTNVR
jgi:hypothetical protein